MKATLVRKGFTRQTLREERGRGGVKEDLDGENKPPRIAVNFQRPSINKSSSVSSRHVLSLKQRRVLEHHFHMFPLLFVAVSLYCRVLAVGIPYQGTRANYQART